MATDTHPSWFDRATFYPPDPIFALTASFIADPDPNKVNLGQGTYRDDEGKPWILSSVHQAREKLISHKLYHEYLPILGLAEFRSRAAEVALGTRIYREHRETLATCQSLSGTGSLHLTGLLLRAVLNPLPKVFIPEPTWSNHHQIFKALGFECQSFPYYDYANKTLDFDSYISTLKSAEPHSIFILHACAHNPTGCDPSQSQWEQIGQIFKDRQLFPLFDAAYLGFNSGDVDEDAFAIRYFVDDLKLETAVCMSFAKNMGLYGERVGCTVLVAKNSLTARNTESMLEMLQRSEVSNPPAFGAKIASTVLGDEQLKKAWYEDMVTMSGRIRSMRTQLHDLLVSQETPGNWNHLVNQTGMFGFLGLSPEMVEQLRDQYHIYMSANSRISIAGLNSHNVEYVARSIKTCLKDQQF
ncbi:aromatic-amino-acid aminotransferase [Aureobasidium pullulans]|uniref:Aspartate aminotransferase n=1 Tax=Aureobasidium pullulans TaxID=5580 RepID=A0A4S9A0W5_AURPU|nr:aromatic-amino-acid aminotransferase [Aureobasidium pullulans]